jgi:hypothetical protein
MEPAGRGGLHRHDADRAAIEEFCYGDPELRNYLRNWALTEGQKRHDVPIDERDETISKKIALGEAA